MSEKFLIGKKVKYSNKRGRIMWATFLTVGILAGLNLIFAREHSIVDILLFSGGTSFLLFVTGFWAVKFKGNIWDLFRTFALPTIVTFLLTFTLEQLFFRRFSRIADFTVFFAIILVFGGIIYVTLLGANIIYLSHKRSLPLTKVAYSVWYILTVATIFFVTYWAVVSSINVFVVCAVLFLTYLVLCFQFLAQFELETRKLIVSSLGMALIIFTITISTFLWPVEVWLRAFFAGVASYITVGYVIHDLNKNLEKRIILEYVVLFIFTIIMLFFLSSWGIYGKLIN